jgi:nucleoside 2-deoxyribosyltransferase
MSVAVFERIEADEFNPNVSFEVGYMKALNKPVCLLKDKTMRTLPTDLLGELYKSFDPQDPHGSIPGELEKWLKDKEMV